MSIDPAAYSDIAIYHQEIAQIFSERYYVGNIHNFPELHCYRALKLGRKIITIRKTDQGMRGFSNVCLHRSNLIDPLGCGQKVFSCGFHGWSYESSGELSHAPFTDRSCITNHVLPIYPLVSSDGLLFLGLSGTQPPVSKIRMALEKVRFTLSTSFYTATISHACNWKILVENILESYHLNFVHRNTFLHSGFTSSSTHEWGSDDYVNFASITPLPSTNKIKTLRKLAKNASHCYRHVFVFPNLFISNTNDLIGYIGHFQPVDERTTLLTWELFELPLMQALAPAVREHIRNESIDFAIATLEEDRQMVESCNIGVLSEMASIQLQPIEGRISQFHSYYNERMDRDH